MAGNLYRRGKTWWGRIQIDGKDHRRSLRTSNRAEALDRLKAWKTEVSEVKWTGEAPKTWMDAVTKYVGEVLHDAVKPETAKRYLVSLRQLHGALGAKLLREITTKTVSDVIAERKRSGATNATIRRDLTAMSRVLSASVSWGWRDDNPARDYDRSIIKERRDPITPPSDEDVAAVINAAPRGARELIEFLAATGCRLEEAASLEWKQVSPERGEVSLYRTKTSRPRTIRLSTPGGDAAGTIAGTPRRLGCPYVFWHGPGQRYVEFSSRFGVLCRAAGVKFRAHDLRHRFAIKWLQNGGDIYALSRHLGHTSVKTTEIYLGYVPDRPAQNPAHVQRSDAG